VRAALALMMNTGLDPSDALKLRKDQIDGDTIFAPGLTLKGLRHTVATTLREAGLDERRIADLLGKKTPSMARRYSRSANLADKNRETMATLGKENARRGVECQTCPPKSVKPGPSKDQT
jgi:integrase